MDLHLLGRNGLANAVFKAWLDATPETTGLRAPPLFLSLRAATRAYALAGGAGRRINPRQAARLLASARRHIDAAIAFLTHQPPLLIALGGNATGPRNLLVCLQPCVHRPGLTHPARR